MQAFGRKIRMKEISSRLYKNKIKKIIKIHHNIYFSFIYLFSFQYNIQCSHSDETLTNEIPGYLQIIITDLIRLTIIMKYGYGLSSPYSLLTLVWIFDIILSEKYTWADNS